MRWSFSCSNNTKEVPRKLYLKEFILEVCRLNRKSVISSFDYCKKLETNLKNYTKNINHHFIDNNDDDNTCILCLGKLIGPCVTYDCKCHLTVHEGCMFRLILADQGGCPQCRGVMVEKLHKPKIQYPLTIDTVTVEEEVDKIMAGKSTPNLSIRRVESNYIKDLPLLKRIYNVI